MSLKTSPIKEAEEVQQNPDSHIDQDFLGFPHARAAKKIITPKTEKERKGQKKFIVADIF